MLTNPIASCLCSNLTGTCVQDLCSSANAHNIQNVCNIFFLNNVQIIPLERTVYSKCDEPLIQFNILKNVAATALLISLWWLLSAEIIII